MSETGYKFYLNFLQTIISFSGKPSMYFFLLNFNFISILKNAKFLAQVWMLETSAIFYPSLLARAGEDFGLVKVRFICVVKNWIVWNEI